MRLYQPSNGTEGDMFMAQWCEKCIHDTAESHCPLIAATMAHQVTDDEYPKEWCYDNKGKPQCTSFMWSDSKEAEAYLVEQHKKRLEENGQTTLFEPTTEPTP